MADTASKGRNKHHTRIRGAGPMFMGDLILPFYKALAEGRLVTRYTIVLDNGNELDFEIRVTGDRVADANKPPETERKPDPRRPQDKGRAERNCQLQQKATEVRRG